MVTKPDAISFNRNLMALPRVTKRRCAFSAVALVTWLVAGGAQAEPAQAPADVAQASDTAAADAALAQSALISTLPTAQLRNLGVQAVQIGRFDVALTLAQELRARDPQDSFAHFLEAQAYLRAGQPDKARRPAHRAFRYAESPVQKHEAARLAAMSHAAEDRYLPAQFWMRRAVHTAPDEVTRNQSALAFRGLRARAPLTLRGGFDIMPSDNVNGGAAQEVFVVDGIDIVGTLSPEARALSGTISRLNGALSYRIHQTPTSETRLRAQGQVQRVVLTQDAQDDAPNAEADDYGYTVFDVGATHFARPWEEGPRLRLSGFIGQGWFGGDHSYDTLRGDVGLHQPIADRTALTLSYGRARQIDAEGEADDILTDTVRLGLLHTLGNDDHVALTFYAGETETSDTRAARSLKGVSLRYVKDDPIGPVTLAALLSGEEAEYPDYPFLFGIPVPGGRQDTQLRARIEFGLHDISYMGFMPTISVSHESTTSNVSRFETNATSVSFGFRSEF